MISILVPVYNYDVTELAAALSRQLDALQRPGEIILLDDGSSAEFRNINAATANLPHVRYIEAGKNHGRIRIRQLLAEKALYDWLLFLDCDSQLNFDTFLHTYAVHVRYAERSGEGPLVIVGGRSYSSEPPGDCNYRLHWQYGSEREAMSHDARDINPYNGFMSNNFVVHKSIFQQLSFASDWQGYGHEDTWIGIQLEKMGVPIDHLDNAAMHVGLENTESFLFKTQQALQNLHRLAKLVPEDALKRHVKLFRVYRQLKGWGLLWLPKIIYTLQRKKIEKNLFSCNPSLFYFDLYRLSRFIQLSGPDK